jgi:hypothetical protein
MAKKVHPNSLANLKMWQPGESGNPAGKPPGTTLTKKLRDIVEKNEGEVADALVRAAVKAALKGDFRFWQEIINRVEGKVADRVAGPDGNDLTITQRIILDEAPPGWEGKVE